MFGGRETDVSSGNLDRMAQTAEQRAQSEANGTDYPHYSRYNGNYGTDKNGNPTPGSVRAGSWHRSDSSTTHGSSYSHDSDHPINNQGASNSSSEPSSSDSSEKSFDLFDTSTW